MGRNRKGAAIDGWLVLDKPEGMTSTQALGKVRWLLGARKAGHGGTLDPLATGVLPIAFGEATKTVAYLMEWRKTYRFTVKWGIETDTDDTEGVEIAASPVRPDLAAIENLLPQFIGTISQVPPKYSAIKIDGQRAYDLARQGQEPEMRAREIVVDSLTLVANDGPDKSTFEAVCGKGTYVRALARDMGRALGTFSHVCALRRTAVGQFCEDTMISLERLEELRHIGAGREAFEALLQPVETALDDIPALAIDTDDAVRLRCGQPIIVCGSDAPVNCDAAYAVCRGALVALGEIRHGEMHPTRVFNMAH
ncbi:MAG: tRNA pseudouridine(55) synthase TruB [Alphaproteobacteria bacterium]